MGKGPTINGVYYEEFGNFYKCAFTVDDITFSCTEQFYQYKKCDNNQELQDQIIKETNPKKMWAIGQKCVLPTNWEIMKKEIMTLANYHKFNQNRNLANKLINTNNADIIFNENNGDFWDITNRTILENIRKNYLKNLH